MVEEGGSGERSSDRAGRSAPPGARARGLDHERTADFLVEAARLGRWCAENRADARSKRVVGEARYARRTDVSSRARRGDARAAGALSEVGAAVLGDRISRSG